MERGGFKHEALHHTGTMGSRAEIDRIRLEADTIMTRYGEVERALEQARSESGAHWETGTLTVTLETPRGEPIDVALELEADPATNAQTRYDRATVLEDELERKAQVVEQLAPLPSDPVAYLLCYHLDVVVGDYPRSIAGHLDAQRDHVDDLCVTMKAAGLLERVESGTVKQRRVKAKQAAEVRQHHTYYRLSRQGDHLLRFLREPEGKLNVLRHIPDGETIVRRLVRGDPDSPRLTAEDLEMEFEYVRHLYRALRQVGLVTRYEGSTIEGRNLNSKSTDEPYGKHTFYVATDRGEEALRQLDE